MQNRHIDRQKYFDEQSYTTQKYVIPFIDQFKPISSEIRVLEIGCGEGGNLKPFLDLGCLCVGIDLSEQQIENAGKFYKNQNFSVEESESGAEKETCYRYCIR